MSFVITPFSHWCPITCLDFCGSFFIPSSVNPHGSSEACDNVYEDVKYANKFILNQNLRKHKAGLKSMCVFDKKKKKKNTSS